MAVCLLHNPSSKRKPIPLPDRDFLLARYHYDPESGELTWKERGKYRKARLGYWAKNGYLVVAVGKTRYLAHRIIWKMVYDEDPDIVDHVNGIRGDNRIRNLRQTTPAGNALNRVGQYGRALPKGVYRQKSGTYTAKVAVNRKVYRLGCFLTIEDARRAYIEAAIKLHGDLARFDQGVSEYGYD